MRYRILFRSVFAVIFVSGVLGVFGQSAGGFSFQINGQVRYADSKAPAANAIVRVERVNGGMAGQQVTDNSGKFSFTGLAGQMYTVTIHAPGFREVRQDIDLLTANTGYVNAYLVKDESAVGNSSRSTQPLLNPPVIDSNVPLEAQKEYAAAKPLIDSGESAKITRAIIHLDKAIALYPKYTEAHLARGLAYMDIREWSRAEGSLRTALEVTPEAVTAYWALGEVYTRQKKWTDAEAILTKGIALNGGVAQGHFALADVYWEMAPTVKDEAAFKRSLENSWKEVRRALELDPRHARAHLLAGNLLLKARKPQEALSHFETYLKLEPKGSLADQTKTLVQKIKQAMASTSKSS
jgi:tetratricopeptide (TPR) repeat protein